MAELPNGGVVWATEDPTMVPPSLSVQAAATVPFENGRVIRPLRFHSYNNYASFIQKLEVTLYRGTDTDLVTPLARIHVAVGLRRRRRMGRRRCPATSSCAPAMS